MFNDDLARPGLPFSPPTWVSGIATTGFGVPPRLARCVDIRGRRGRYQPVPVLGSDCLMNAGKRCDGDGITVGLFRDGLTSARKRYDIPADFDAPPHGTKAHTGRHALVTFIARVAEFTFINFSGVGQAL
jgi:hypothetical protein